MERKISPITKRLRRDTCIMILEQLSLTDFRVFQGQHTFDLAPRVKYGKKRPIILYGGLNGAGKTTTLTAVRLALYGKQCLGLGTAQKSYDDFLEKSIHKSKYTLIQANSSSIELTFSYANMGDIKHYTVKRSWMLKGKKIIENLCISENNHELKELNDEQCQGFLNELIPIGVSDLFFFDSEKIAELAEDTGGFALGDAIKKLLGLDLIDTLNADLTVLLRNESKKSTTLETQKEIDILENELESHEMNAGNEQQAYENTRASLFEIDQNLQRLENELSARGGAWAATREEELENQILLNTEKEQLQKEIRELLDSSYPISLAKIFVKKTLKQLLNESFQKKLDNTAELVNKHLTSLEKNLKKVLDNVDFKNANKAIEKEFSKITQPMQKTVIIHDVSDSALSVIKNTINDAINNQATKLNQLAKSLSEVNNKIDMAGKNISRAPEESLIKPIMNEIINAQEKRGDIIARQKTHLSKRKTYLNSAIEIVRKLDKLSSQFTSADQKDRTIQYAKNSKSLLNEFAKEMAKRKVKDLEDEFVNSYYRLARKNDIHLRALINPEDFSVKLMDENAIEIEKNALSAGEKQIYAIAILEALARTSGRKLPIIIDTPLARLDSVHRTKLIKNYFPYASHQVIILSTDTEVDEEFYSELSSSISHAYKLDYNTNQKYTTAKEGYFWKTKQAEAV